ncbi:winged helix-turn-helix transcriptional regulator [Jannaschia seohaensis]|uniref:DNA-binding HxlR family transcriptional regulator n=1 Tax=Jannaschia seohaensis TaxID=475081 RepID=A0A2Y9A5D8_9RHOB|nr:helix-turn-helix domain-containing protein [Jannaschia seohaensis]PWJ21625.1 DNA-binding HxlR family transcriptional regulator [Jannaschia seohaensis]SSA37417.1 DNA-binding transcriptional regulator, HxlR family [Jannaschia seohaensis]
MSETNYPKFCPVAMAASLLEPRWTMLMLCEMWSGSTRFSEIQRGVPGMSPGLLSKRLKELEANGLVVRRTTGAGGHVEYLTTPIADELQPHIRALGEWAHRNIDCDVSLKDLDARLLMWKIRGKIDLLQLPKGKRVIQFILNDAPNATANYWLVTKPGEETDLCFTDPKYDVDLYVVCELRALTSAWMGHTRFETEIERERIVLSGHELMARTLTKWLTRSSFADVGKRSPATTEARAG